MSFVPSPLEDELARFYDREAADGRRGDPEAGRTEHRRHFLELLAAEGRTSVVEVGLGPGRDAAAMLAAGMQVAGVDLAGEHVRLCGALGVDARRGSALALPWTDGSFDAGWTMSTLLHLPDEQIPVALDELGHVVAPGAPIAIGLWGGADLAGYREDDRYDPPRWFRFRTDAQVLAMVDSHGTVEQFTTWQPEGDRFSYQWVVLRTPC